jgi:hypothetical protein
MIKKLARLLKHWADDEVIRGKHAENNRDVDSVVREL